MLSKPHRITSTTEFEKIYKHGKKYFCKYFVLYVLPVSGQPNVVLPKFGIVASKKVGRATVRNKAKRQMREIIKKELPLLNKNFLAVIITFGSLADSAFHEVAAETQSIFKQAGLYKVVRK